MDCSGLETYFVKAPADALARSAKTTAKSIETQLKKISTALDRLKEHPEERTTVVAKLKKQLISLKKKAKSQLDAEDKLAKQTSACLNHLRNGLLANSAAERAAWQEHRLHRFIIDHLLRCGHYGTAAALSTQPQIAGCYNLDLFQELADVEAALRHRDLNPALAWCKTHETRLKKKKSTLAVTLICQQMIELVRTDQSEAAIALATQHTDLFMEHPEDLQLVMGSMVMADAHLHPRYGHFFASERWDHLIDQLRRNALSLHGLVGAAPLELALAVGLAALKCDACGRDVNPQCPTCQSRLSRVAEHLPVGNRAQSVLVCRLTGQVMSDTNYPMMLPNGNVYSYEGLAEQQRRNDCITCPRTQSVYKLSQCKRLYIM
eukprot:TRINITY_DN9753_c0_g1_i3.p1 TRINITY_DN9753_c0_g1~~TRINITY_DN9753_c0_g1_i3.p1  ORF type:complete len:405 (+),score=64.42 TRINITY_DN9753_c0_g1_i3:85-1215(+)